MRCLRQGKKKKKIWRIIEFRMPFLTKFFWRCFFYRTWNRSPVRSTPSFPHSSYVFSSALLPSLLLAFLSSSPPYLILPFSILFIPSLFPCFLLSFFHSLLHSPHFSFLPLILPLLPSFLPSPILFFLSSLLSFIMKHLLNGWHVLNMGPRTFAFVL